MTKAIKQLANQRQWGSVFNDQIIETLDAESKATIFFADKQYRSASGQPYIKPIEWLSMPVDLGSFAIKFGHKI